MLSECSELVQRRVKPRALLFVLAPHKARRALCPYKEQHATGMRFYRTFRAFVGGRLRGVGVTRRWSYDSNNSRITYYYNRRGSLPPAIQLIYKLFNC